jgi:hypothetical protein
MHAEVGPEELVACKDVLLVGAVPQSLLWGTP